MTTARLRAWLPADRTNRLFIIPSFIDSVGSGLFLAGSALFFTRVLGLSTGQVGIGLSLSGVAGLLGTVPFGRLADRIGGKKVLILLYLWRGAGFAVYPLVHGAHAFFAVACFIGFAEWSVSAVVQAVVGTLGDGGSRVRTMATIAAVRNAGFAIGAVVATLTVAFGDTRLYTALVLTDAATFFIAAALLSRLRIPATAAPRRTRGARVRVRDPRYLTLTCLNSLLYMHTVLLAVGLPLWVATRTAAPKVVVGAVLVVNTAVAILFQVPLSRGSHDIRSAARRQQWAGWSLAGCCVLAALTAHAGAAAASVLILAAAAALTLGEIWQSVGAWGLSYALSPESQRAYYLSVYNLGLSGATVVGPALVTFAVIRNGAVGWVALAAVFALTGLAVVLVARGAVGVSPDVETPADADAVTG
jgi:MFS family permease